MKLHASETQTTNFAKHKEVALKWAVHDCTVSLWPSFHAPTVQQHAYTPVIQTRSTNKDERRLEYYYTLMFVYIVCDRNTMGT